MGIEVVGVVGAGVMGRGVAQNLAQTNHRVFLLDVSEEILEQAKREIEKNVRFHRLFNKTSAAESLKTTMSRIEFSTSYSRFAEADFVVENVTEKWPIKQKVYEQLEAETGQRQGNAAGAHVSPGIHGEDTKAADNHDPAAFARVLAHGVRWLRMCGRCCGELSHDAIVTS